MRDLGYVEGRNITTEYNFVSERGQTPQATAADVVARAPEAIVVVGLSPDEIAFYGALAENESAVQVMGDKNLRVIAHELLVSVRGQPFRRLDAPRGGAGRLRVLVKRILRKHGYPPDLQEAAVQTVIQQAEGRRPGGQRTVEHRARLLAPRRGVSFTERV